MLGGGAGHIFDMIARIRENASLLKKSRYFKTKRQYLKVTYGQKISFRETKKEELEAIRQKIKKERKLEIVKDIIAWTITLILTGLVIYWVLLFIEDSVLS